jgi:hypothetical protein
MASSRERANEHVGQHAHASVHSPHIAPGNPGSTTTELFGARIPFAQPELHSRWTLWLILAGLSNYAIHDVLAEGALPCPSSGDLDRRRATNQPPPGFGLKAPFTTQTTNYLMALRLDRLAAGASDARRAVDILHMPRVREFVESALILRVPGAPIASLARQLLDVSLTEGAVRAYGDLFLRLDVLSTAQLKIAIEDRVRLGLRKVASKDSDPSSLARAVAEDPRVVATKESSLTAWPVVLATMGLSVSSQTRSNCRTTGARVPTETCDVRRR